MDKPKNTVSAIIYIIVGLLLIVKKGSIIGLAIDLIGLAAIIMAIIDLMGHKTHSAIVKGVVGVCILVFGWMFVNLALYILGAAIIIMGLIKISNITNTVYTGGQKFVACLKPGVTVLAGLCLLFNPGGAISWMFIATGGLLIANGALELIG